MMPWVFSVLLTIPGTVFYVFFSSLFLLLWPFSDIIADQKVGNVLLTAYSVWQTVYICRLDWQSGYF